MATEVVIAVTRAKEYARFVVRAAGIVAILSGLACGARTELGVSEPDASAPEASRPDASAPDASTPDVLTIEASTPDVMPDLGAPDVPPLCDFGTLVSDPFGSTVLWNGGASLPAGHYRVTYVDGCMKYSSGQAWSVNAYADGPDTLFVVGDGVTLAPAPGTVGFLEGQGGFASFDDCVNANLANDVPVEFDFGGGTLGLMLEDNPYSDNVAGENGRSPTYRLSSCP